MPNLYGDILSDVAAQIAGSVGLAGSANIGTTGRCSRRSTARRRDIAGQQHGQPVGIAAGRGDDARAHRPGRRGRDACRTRGWRRSRTGCTRRHLTRKGSGEGGDPRIRAGRDRAPRAAAREAQGGEYAAGAPRRSRCQRSRAPTANKDLVGVDVFLRGRRAEELAARCSDRGDGLKLKVITNRGVKVWPGGARRRSAPITGAAGSSGRQRRHARHGEIASLLARIAARGLGLRPHRASVQATTAGRRSPSARGSSGPGAARPAPPVRGRPCSRRGTMRAMNPGNDADDNAAITCAPAKPAAAGWKSC